MTALTTADHATTFTVHPLEGSSRFSLLGLLAGLNGLVGAREAAAKWPGPCRYRVLRNRREYGRSKPRLSTGRWRRGSA